MPRCWTCGIEMWICCIFRNRSYCKEHYEEHMEKAREVDHYLLFEEIKEL